MTVAESAVSVLHNLANDTGVPAQTRVTAAGKILDMALRAHELLNIKAEIEELKERLGIAA